MRQVERFMRHARRLRENAQRARRLALSIAGDDAQERLMALAERLDARCGVAERCAGEALRREAVDPRAAGDGTRPPSGHEDD
jgi:hypothetical protein